MEGGGPSKQLTPVPFSAVPKVEASDGGAWHWQQELGRSLSLL